MLFASGPMKTIFIGPAVQAMEELGFLASFLKRRCIAHLSVVPRIAFYPGSWKEEKLQPPSVLGVTCRSCEGWSGRKESKVQPYKMQPEARPRGGQSHSLLWAFATSSEAQEFTDGACPGSTLMKPLFYKAPVR